nr:ATP-binding protein [Kibdelosporangium sp. MJ126-NF4]CEL15479.1 hypothetical protein [Kibdelosporangium sp. MJ126-NF4]CTQ92119.1 hypothetical protein [Kibdelosporangium sp. MJ126-NF4]
MAMLSYADAVKLLGAKESKIVTALDKVLGGALLAGSGVDLWGLLGWFDAKAEFIRLSHELVTKVSGRRLSRHDRTERLHAAHTVIVLVAFFEAFDELELGLGTKDLGPTKQHGSGLPSPTIYGDEMLYAAVPVPGPEFPHDRYIEELTTWYTEFAVDLRKTVSQLAIWDSLNETRQGLVHDRVGDKLPPRAVRRYEELFRQLAADFPEVAYWRQSHETQALGTALARLETALEPITTGDSPSERRAELARRYRAMLNHSIIEPDQVPDGLSIPKLAECYVDPNYQVCESDPGASFASKEWWDGKPVRHDIHLFLAGYLTSPRAAIAPLLVLGDPGSGKSVLTKVLAARLPASDFLVLRVELRTTPADTDIREQIEHGLRELLQEQVNWPTLVRSAGAALPVVVLDGFDELLQATGVSQTDYLTRIARFQRDSAELGRPVAFVVTSRISVADRAATPKDSAVLRLVPFQDTQIAQWLRVWNRVNAQYFTNKGLGPLAAGIVARYADLSEQPLLLLMLALYDADGNALHNSGLIREAELYERLLTTFARREVSKNVDHRSEGEIADAVEAELQRLSIVAFSMFNRGTQWVSEQDLDEDLGALLPRKQGRRGTRAPLGAGEAVLGRFFFVQRAQAIRDERTLRTYEFLHATFGEYLVARATWQILRNMTVVESSRRPTFTAVVDDTELYALLSFAPLSSRAPVIGFLRDMSAQLTVEDRAVLADLLIGMFTVVRQPRPSQAFADYEPIGQSMAGRQAVYSLNLVLLIAMVKAMVTGTELFGENKEIAWSWSRCATLWQSQLSEADWSTLLDTLQVSRFMKGNRRDLSISVGPAPAIAPVDLGWIVDEGVVGAYYLDITDFDIADTYRREANFLCRTYNDLVSHAITPLADFAPESLGLLSGLDRRSQSSAHALLTLLLDPTAADIDTVKTALIGVILKARRAGEHPTLGRAVVDILRLRPEFAEVAELVSLPEFSSNIGTWILLCERIGKGGDDIALTELLCESWDKNRAFRKIPEYVLDAWLRVAERGSELSPNAPSLHHVVAHVDMLVLERTRPDLITRARLILGDRFPD